MKIFTIFLLFFFGGQTFSQKYQFKYFVQNKFTNDNIKEPGILTSFFANPDNNFILFLNKKESGFNAYFFDYVKSLRHYLKVIENNGKLSFEYLYTNDMKNIFPYRSKNKSPFIEVSKLTDYKYEIKIFANEKKKTLTYHIITRIEKSKINFPKFSIESRFENEIFNQLKKEVGKEDFYVKEANIYYVESKMNSKNILEYIEEVNLEILIPNKLVYKKYEPWKEN